MTYAEDACLLIIMAADVWPRSDEGMSCRAFCQKVPQLSGLFFRRYARAKTHPSAQRYIKFEILGRYACPVWQCTRRRATFSSEHKLCY